MTKLLDFYSNAAKTISEAPTGHVPTLDRLMLQAHSQIMQERLVAIIERLVVGAPVQQPVAPGTSAQELLSALEDIQGGAEPDRVYHPSPFAGDIDLGPDEARLSPEQEEADQQLRAEIAAVTEAAMKDILEKRKK